MWFNHVLFSHMGAVFKISKPHYEQYDVGVYSRKKLW